MTPAAENGTITFTIPQSDKFLPKLMGNFQSRLLSINLRRPTLDDVFLKLTGRAIREESAGMREMAARVRAFRGRH